jgi:hypothetical protein
MVLPASQPTKRRKDTVMHMFELRKGMLVQASSSRGGWTEICRVENPKVKKVTILRENGEQWDFYPAGLKPAPEGATFNLQVEEVDSLPPGAAVMWTPRANVVGEDRDDVFVILSRSQAGYKMAKLFGQAGRYYHSIPSTSIREATHEDVAEYLLARANRV